jgi:eukaryotic-like serine/threonine-protein kinase
VIGQTVSHYRILSKLGEGGMGTVYVAEDTLLGRRVAIKSLKLASVPSQKNYRSRFLREARAASRLNHPHIATVHDFGETDDGQPYLVMELIDGQSLSDLLREDSLPVDEAVGIVKQVVEAIAEAHRHGIVHRDVKPSNVVLNQRHEVKVLDFGLAKLVEADELTTQRIGESATETLEGVVVGTPSYLSPEQALGTPVDKRSDIFSIGTLLYECLTGVRAFKGSTVGEIFAQVIRDDPPQPSQLNPRVTNELDRITLKALAKKTEARYQTAEDLLHDLNTLPLQSTEAPGSHLIGARFRSSTAWLSSRVTPRKALILSAVIIVALLAVIWISTRRPKSFEPAPEAKRLYDAGTQALREGSYFKASKLFEQSIQQDKQFPLAHARLAQTWIELDYEDRATDEMLRVTELVPNLSALPALDLLYLQAITGMVRRNYQGAVENFEEIARRLPENEKPPAFADVGRAYESARDLEHAAGAYEEVTKRDPQAAAAFMRLGSVYGRRQQNDKAIAAFDKAQSLYDAQGNVEGMAEVFFQRGAFFNVGDKLPEAKEQLQHALDLARTTNNKSQEIKTLLQLGSVFYSTGETLRAEEYATRAVELARAEQLDNLTTNGLIDIGNALFLRGEYAEAQKRFEQALQIATANKGRRAEARALLSLGSLMSQQGSGAKAVSYLEPALAFYRQGNFARETSQALLLLGYSNEQQGNNEAALESFNEQLKLAQQVNDKAQVAHTHAAIGLLLSHQERFTEALAHYEESYRLNKELGLDPKIIYDLFNKGHLLWQIGNYAAANETLKQAFDAASSPGGVNKQALARIHLIKAQMALSQFDYSGAVAESRKALALTSAQEKEPFVQASYTIGLAQLSSGTSSATVSCQKAFDIAKQDSRPRLVSSAQLALAEALLATGDATNALSSALQAQEIFARLGQRHSEWRAWLIAAQSSRRLNDGARVAEYATRAEALLKALENAFGTDEYRSYLSRPDVKRYRQQLNELLPGAND